MAILFLTKIETYQKLGPGNVIRVVWYLLRLKSGWFKYRLPIGPSIEGKFYQPQEPQILDKLNPPKKKEQVFEPVLIFGWYRLLSDSVPDWGVSIFTNKQVPTNRKHWCDISDFDSGVGDIKGIWELSRFNWVLNFTFNYLATHDQRWLDKLNLWLSDWSKKNPVNQGPNWKCAQEASIRVLHLASAALISKSWQPNTTLAEFINQHLARISPTLGYAKAQDNNHGTSEGAALYVGGSWLLVADPNNQQAKQWRDTGQQYLHERVARLIMKDGTFSQYSLVYHRLMLDSLSFVELWRRELALPDFSDGYVQSMQAATSWMLNMIDKSSGDGPNLGANDGAHILNFTQSPSRDFRPTAELACQLFLKQTAFTNQTSKAIVLMFNLQAKKPFIWPEFLKMADGGYGVLRQDDTLCLLNVPNYQFRPSQADMLHLDFWLNGENLLRDAGTFSYNTEPEWLDYFSGIQAHNSVQFDAQQPMPKISRFLFAKWPSYNVFGMSNKQGVASMQASYKSVTQYIHSREVHLSQNQLRITDRLKRVKQFADLRWRLPAYNWTIDGERATCGNITIILSSNDPSAVVLLEEGFESKYYGQKNSIPVLTYRVSQDAEIKTIITW